MYKLKFTVISAIIFGISLFFPCFYTNDSINGAAALFWGFMGMVAGGSNLCWLANPLLFGSWITSYFNNLMSFLFSIFAFIISYSFYFATEIAVDEAGTPREITRLGIAYWLWLLSIFVMLISTSVKLYQNYSKAKMLPNN